MTDNAGNAGSSIQMRQWLYENLARTESNIVTYPPPAIVDALEALGLPSPFDIGWSEMAYDHRSEVTTWTCTVATAEHLVDLTAEAQRKGGKTWTGDERTAVEYITAPTVSVVLSRIDAVAALDLSTEGARDSADDAFPTRQTWQFTFADKAARTYVIDSRASTSSDMVASLCRRLAANV